MRANGKTFAQRGKPGVGQNVRRVYYRSGVEHDRRPRRAPGVSQLETWGPRGRDLSLEHIHAVHSRRLPNGSEHRRHRIFKRRRGQQFLGGDRDCVKQRAPVFHLRREPLALGDVADNRDGMPNAPDTNAGHRKLDWKLRAVLAQRLDFERRVQNLAKTGFCEVRETRGRSLAIPLRGESRVRVASQYLGAGVAEDPFRGWIPVRDIAFGVGLNDRAGSILAQKPELLLGLAELTIDSVVFGQGRFQFGGARANPLLQHDRGLEQAEIGNFFIGAPFGAIHQRFHDFVQTDDFALQGALVRARTPSVSDQA